MASIYESNKTMKIIGRQTIEIIAPNGVAYEDFKNVFKAHIEKGTKDAWDIACDFFLLGLLYGKRLERHKRNRTEIRPLGIGEMLNENK